MLEQTKVRRFASAFVSDKNGTLIWANPVLAIALWEGMRFAAVLSFTFVQTCAKSRGVAAFVLIAS